MITSFGNDESDGSESDSNDETPSESKTEKLGIRKPSEYTSREKKPEAKPVSRRVEIGPCLPPKIMPQIQNSVAKETFTSELENSLSSKPLTSADSKSSDEEDILRRLKNQAKLLQFLDENAENSSENLKNSSPRVGSPNEVERNVQSKNKKLEKRSEKQVQSSSEFKVSLVPGYEDDSENEEETTHPTEVKPLFPISEYQQEKSSSTSSNDTIVKKVETRKVESGCIRIFEYRNVESEKVDASITESKELDKEIDSVENSETESRVSQPVQETEKANAFLENLETPAKAFQRKKRIAFDGEYLKKSKILQAELFF